MKSRTYIYIVFLLTVGVSFACIGVKPAQAVSEAGLVSYWKLDEGTGIKAKDSSGNLNLGTLENMASPATAVSGWTTAGKIGRGVLFDGTNDYVWTTTALTSPQNFSLTLWFKTTSASGHKLVGFENTQFIGATGYDRHIWMGTDGKIYFGVWVGAAFTVSSLNTLNDGNWHQVTATYAPSGFFALYVDGVLQGTNSGIPGDYGGYWKLGGYNLAGWPNASDGYFSGTLDDVRIYSRVLSAAEAKSLYQSGGATRLAQPTQPNQSGLVGYWKFDEDTGKTAKDWSGNGKTATLNSIAEPSTATSGWTSKGKMSRALNFDGTNDYVSTLLPLNSLSAMTISWWEKTSVDTQAAGVISADNGSSGRFIIQENSGGSIGPVYADGPVFPADFSVILGDGVWHMYTLTVSSFSSGTWRLYRDGVLFLTTTGYSFTPSSQTLELGTHVSGVGGYWTGSMDDVRVYNRALSTSEVLALYKTTGNITKQVDENGLIGYWKFDEGATNKAADSSGNNHRGILKFMSDPATPTSGWTNAGKFGRAVAFDGSDDYVDLGSSSLIAALPRATVSVWIKPNAASLGAQGKGIYSESNVGGTVYHLGLGSGKLYFSIYRGGTWYDAISSSVLTVGNWYHVVGVLGPNGMTAYINGVQDGTNGNTLPSDFSISSVLVGNFLNAGAYEFDGVIDDVRVYNRALSVTEIQVLYQSGTTRVNP